MNQPNYSIAFNHAMWVMMMMKIIMPLNDIFRAWVGFRFCYGVGYMVSVPEDPEQVTDKTRHLGLVVIRGTQVSLVSPEDGLEEIANPFLGGADEEEDEAEAEG